MDELVSELRALRKGRGLTKARLEKSPALMKVLAQPSTDEAFAKLVRVIKSLGDDLRPAALLNAYGLAGDTSDLLTTRRDNFAVNNERHTDTVEAYENAMIEELAAALRSQEQSVSEIDVSVTVENGLLSQILEKDGNRLTISHAWRQFAFAVYQLSKNEPRAVVFRVSAPGAHVIEFYQHNSIMRMYEAADKLTVRNPPTPTVRRLEMKPNEVVEIRWSEEYPDWLEPA